MRMYVVYHKQLSYNNINNTNSKTQVQNLDSLAQPQLFDPLRSDVLRNDLIVGENPKPLLGGARVKVRGIRAREY